MPFNQGWTSCRWQVWQNLTLEPYGALYRLFIFSQGADFYHQNCATLPAHVKDVSKEQKSVTCLNQVEKRHSAHRKCPFRFTRRQCIMIALIFAPPRLAHTQPDYFPSSFPCPLTLLQAYICIFFSFRCCESCIYRCAFRFQDQDRHTSNMRSRRAMVMMVVPPDNLLKSP